MNRYDELRLSCEDEDCRANTLAVARYINEVGKDNADIAVICAILGIRRDFTNVQM